MKVQRKVLLKQYNTFKIGGLAEYFCEAKSREDLILAIKWAKEKRLPFFVLGNGSNILIPDKGIKGLVIKIRNTKYEIKNANIIADAGVYLTTLVSLGLEWAVGIPGTVGGAVCCNAGAFNKSMKDVINSVEVFDAKEKKIKIFKNKDCEFSYRSSIFKKKKNFIILSANMKKGKGDVKKIKEYLERRKKNQPLNYPSAGSIFKNPSGFSAGELIEKCGLKGKTIGGAKISKKHANFIINLGDAESKDVKKLINLAKQEVKKKFKVDLKEEIIFL